MNEIFNFLVFWVFINENELGKSLLASLYLKVKVCTNLLTYCLWQNNFV